MSSTAAASSAAAAAASPFAAASSLDRHQLHGIETIIHQTIIQIQKHNPCYDDRVFHQESYSSLVLWAERSGFSSALGFLKVSVPHIMNWGELSTRCRVIMSISEIPHSYQMTLASPAVLEQNFRNNEPFLWLLQTRMGMESSPEYCARCERHRPLNPRPRAPVYYLTPVPDAAAVAPVAAVPGPLHPSQLVDLTDDADSTHTSSMLLDDLVGPRMTSTPKRSPSPMNVEETLRAAFDP